MLSINSIYREFSQHNYIKNILDILLNLNLAPDNIELELSEENFLRNPVLSRDIANQMATSGMKLAIDNFGDGMTNLGALTGHSIQRLKMTRKCVENISDENTAKVMAKTLIDIAHNLDMLVVADGVETENQALYLRSSGCDQLQGHYFSPPLEEEAMFDILASSNAG